MKKYYLNLGFMGLVAIPVVALVSCSDSKSSKFSFSDEKAKFNDVVSRKTAKELNSDVNSVTPSAAQLGFDEPTLSDGATATYSIVDTIFIDGVDKVVTVTLTHGKETDTTTFNLSPKPSLLPFDFSDDKAKFVDLSSKKTASELITDVTSNMPTPDQLGFEEPILSNGTTASYRIDDHIFIGTNIKVVTVTLTHGLESITTNFNLKPKSVLFNFDDDIAKFVDSTSTKTAAQLSSSVISTNPSPDQLGFTQPTDLSTGTTVTYEIDNQTFTGIDAKLVTVTLTHGTETAIATFNLTPLYDINIDKIKFTDTVSSKIATQLSSDVDLANVTPEQLGFEGPILTNGVTASYSIDDATFTNGTDKVVTVTLTHGEETDIVNFNLRPKFDFSDDIAKFVDSTSTKTAAELSSSVISTNPSPDQLGFTQPADLSIGTDASYSIVDQTFTGIDTKLVTVTLTNGNETDMATFNLRPKFDFSSEVIKFTDAVSSKTATELSTSVDSTTPSASQLGFTEPPLIDGVIATYSIVNQTFTGTTPKAVTVTLTHDEDTTSTTFNLRPKSANFDFSIDIAQFIDSTSTKTAAELSSSVISTNPTADALGFTEPTGLLSDTITYEIDDQTFTGIDAKLVTVTLTYGEEKTTTTFHLTPLYDINIDKAKFTDTLSSKTATELSSDVDLANLTPEQFGFEGPILINGTTASYSIDDATFTNGTVKVVTVTLTHGDETDTVNFNLRPKFDFSADITKFTDVISSMTAAELSSNVGSTTPTADALGFTEPTDLLSDTITYKIIDQTFTGTTAKLVTVTLTHGEEKTTTTFNLTPKFDFSADLTKFTDATSIKTATELNSDVGSTAPSADALGFREPTTDLSTGTTASYEIENNTFEGIIAKAVTVTLHHDGQTDMKTFNLTPKFSFDVDIAKFPKTTFFSSKTTAELTSDVTSTQTTANQLGFTEPILINGVTATYQIPDYVFSSTTTKTVVVILSYGTQTTKFTFKLAPKFDLDFEKNKFKNSISTKIAAELSSDVDSTDATPDQLGFTQPILPDGTTVSYKLLDSTFIGTTPKEVTVTLTHGDATVATTFNLTPKFDFSVYTTKFTDATSSKTATELSSEVDATSPTPEQLGFTEPPLTDDVTASYSIGDATFTGITPKVVTVTLTHNEQITKFTFDLTPKFDFSVYTAKFTDATSSKLATELSSEVDATSPTPEQLGFIEPPLTDGVTASYSIGDATFTGITPKEVTVTLTYGEDTVKTTFNLTPKFDFSGDVVKFTNAVSSKTATELNTDVDSTTPSANQLGFTQPTDLSIGTIATYAIPDRTFNGKTPKEVTVTLTHNGQITKVIFNLVPKFDFSSYIVQFTDAISSKTATQLNTDVTSTKPNADALGFKEPILTNDVTVTYSIVDHTFTDITPKEVTITLHYGNEVESKTFNLTPKYDFSADLAKFNDVTSTRTASELSNLVDSVPTPDQLGFKEPILTDGVTASYKILDSTFTGIIPKEVTVTLTYGEETTATTFELRPKYDFSADLTKFNNNVVSSKTAAELISTVTSTNPTPDALGFTQPTDLSTGTTATYEIENKTFSNTTAKVVTVTLTNGSDTATTTFNLMSKIDLDFEKNKFQDVTSSKTTTELNAVVDSNHPTANQLGYTPPILHNGVVVTYSIEDHTFTGITPKIVTVTLANGDETVKTTFNLTPKYDFSGDLAKFNDMMTSTKTAAELNTIGTNTPTAIQLGFTEPILSSDKTISYSIPDHNFANGIPKEVTVTITNNLGHDSKTFNLISKFGANVDIPKFKDAISSKNFIQLRTDAATWVDATHPTPEELGFTQPILSGATTVTYSIDDTTFTIDAKVISVTLTNNGQSGTITFNLTPLLDTVSKQTYLKEALLPTKAKLIIGSTEPIGITTYEQAKQALNAAKAFATSSNEVELDKAVVDAREAIYDANAYNQKILEANDGLQLVGDTRILLDGSDISVIVISKNGLWVGGADGKWDHIEGNGQKVNGWTTKTLFGGSKINSAAVASDGIWIGGPGGKLGFWVTTGSLFDFDSHVTTLFNGANINTVLIFPWRNIPIFIGGDAGNFATATTGGRFDIPNDLATHYNVLGGSSVSTMSLVDLDRFYYIDGLWIASNDGKIQYFNLKTGPSENIIQLFADKSAINSIISDKHGGFWVAGAGGKLDHIDANGHKVSGWTTKTLLGGSDINSIVLDGHGGLWVAGAGGKLDHVDANGHKVSGWTTKTLLGGSDINSIVATATQLWVGGPGGKLDILLYTPPIS